MKLFLQINLGDWKTLGYSSPWIEQAKKSGREITVADVDPESEPAYVNHLNTLAEQVDEIFVFVKAEDNTKLGVVMPLLYSLLRMQHKVKCVCMQGKHTHAEKILRTFGDKFLTDLPETEVAGLLDEFCGE